MHVLQLERVYKRADAPVFPCSEPQHTTAFSANAHKVTRVIQPDHTAMAFPRGDQINLFETFHVSFTLVHFVRTSVVSYS